MGQKRSREALPAVTRKRGKKLKKKKAVLVPAVNSFELLPTKETSESDNDIELVDSDNYSDDSDIVVESDKDEAGDAPAKKKQKVDNEITTNNDFIGFGFQLSDEEEAADVEQYSDDGVLSDDNSGATHARREAKPVYQWVKQHDHSKQEEIADWLTLEIKDFVSYISPSKDEITTRNQVIGNLKKSITGFWPATQAHVFGSCATDLYLPGSDIDMVVISTTGDYEQRSKLYQLSSFLRTNKLAKNIEVIATAKVPIIKFVDPTHNIHVDISFERTNGLDAARRIRRWLDTTPGLRELVLIVKQFLRSRRLNNVHVGGLGGYATIILVYHFLKLHPRVATGSMNVMENLGSLLIEFFELYGRNFSYDNLIIALNPADDSPKYMRKSGYPTLTAGKGQFSIIVQDPSDPDNNITRSSYNLRDLKKAFGGAYQLLVDKCYELNSASYRNRIGALILGDIIKFRGKDRDFNDDRDKVVNSALINHMDSDSESDGANGNDKYYFSDMTASEDDTYVPQVAGIQKKKAKKVKKEKQKKPEPKPKPAPKADLKKVEDYMSLAGDSEEESEESKAANLDKDVKREYWKLKGLEI